MILGCDPGIHGALALLDEDGGLFWVKDMPIASVQQNKRNVSRIVPALLAGLFRNQIAPFAQSVAIEQVGARPGEAPNRAFQFGQGHGMLLGCASMLAVPIVPYTPAKWRALAKVKGTDKTGSRYRAAELWPEKAELFARVKDDGRAEAALIAYAHWLESAQK